MTDRRFIEESFPVKEVSAISAKEKNIRHGHISTLHVWWARRPLAASRSTAYAALTPAADDITEWQRQRDFIVELSKWENSLNAPLLERARRDILEAHAEHLSAERGEPVTVEDIQAGRAPRPRVLDPFAGGGAIPLEALRLGCETYANDYNPVAVLILKATQEYPQKFGQPVEVEKSSDLFGGQMTEKRTINPLLEAVKEWGDWVLEEARKELADFYPPDPDGSIPVGYIWARTIPCQNPKCEITIPLMLQFWLSKKRGKRVAVHPNVTTAGEKAMPNGSVQFEIVGDAYLPWPEDFDPGQGTISNAVVTCPFCGSVVDPKTLRRLFREGRSGHQFVAVILTHPDRAGKTYRIATEKDRQVFREAERRFGEIRECLMVRWGIDPVPDETICPRRPSPNARGASGLTRYAMYKWGDVFNTRNLLTLTTFVEAVRQAHDKMIEGGSDPQFATAVSTYLALILGKLSTFQNVLTRWNTASTSFAGKPDQAPTLAMKWDYAESNPFSGVTGSYNNQFKAVLRALEVLPVLHGCVRIAQNSATQLQYEDGFFDTVLTDPPYYDNFPYSHLSDFFYAWLKRTVGHLHLDHFATPETPKAKEIVAYSLEEGGFEAGKRFFEEELRQAFKEIYRVLKSNGIAVVVYAHKSTEGWETVINALLDSGLISSGAWPLATERKGRRQAHKSAALTSSIYIVARKMARQPTGFYNEVREELRCHLDRKLHRLWEEGIGGADFFIAAIGSAIEVFGKYEQVMDYEGNVIRADRLLQDVRTIATDYAVRQILRDGFVGEVSDLTRLYVLWRWNYSEARVPFDEARKLAQSCGVDLAREWGRGGFVKKEREFVRLLGPQRRKLDDLEDSRELIDVLHRVLLLWEKGRREEMVQALAASGYGRSEAFYRVAQAVSETLPNDSKEKKLLDGFLVGRERVREEVGKTARQERLWEE